MLLEAEDDEYDVDELHSAQTDFALEGRQMHQMEQVYVCICLLLFPCTSSSLPTSSHHWRMSALPNETMLSATSQCYALQCINTFCVLRLPPRGMALVTTRSKAV